MSCIDNEYFMFQEETIHSVFVLNSKALQPSKYQTLYKKLGT